MKQLTICADDFAMSEGVSRTIVELAHAGKVNAISCMALSPRWEWDSGLLADLSEHVEVGLHLVLTDELPLTHMPRLAGNGRLPSAERLGRLARQSRLSREEILAEVRAQFDRFEEVLSRQPAFVDGHQHIHFMPGIRDIVIQATLERAPRAWLRTCEDDLFRMLQRPFRLKALVNAFQSAGFAKAAERAGLNCNDSFAGLYDFKTDFSRLLPRFLAPSGERHLVICHPGDCRNPEDRISSARVMEADVLRHSFSLV